MQSYIISVVIKKNTYITSICKTKEKDQTLSFVGLLFNTLDSGKTKVFLSIFLFILKAEFRNLFYL